jgi:hypothetical protein
MGGSRGQTKSKRSLLRRNNELEDLNWAEFNVRPLSSTRPIVMFADWKIKRALFATADCLRTLKDMLPMFGKKRSHRPFVRHPVFRPQIEVLEGRSLPSTSWLGFAHDAQHTANSTMAAEPLGVVRWQTPVDLNPQLSGNDLLIHYGSPLLTPSNTVIVPVKTGASGGFEVQAISGSDGTIQWTQTTDYILPPHDWTPSFQPTLTPQNRLYFAGAGGTIYYIANPDASGTPTVGHIAFYGISNYTSSGFDNTVFINTPITSDSAGNIYFGFQVTGSNPLNLISGFARIDANGHGTWVSASAATGDSGITKVVHNCAPALSDDGSLVYVAMSNADGTNSGHGYLVALNSTTLATVHKVALKDPKSSADASLPDDGTASPTVGLDGDVYFGVLENPFPENNDRGWLLHFSGDLTQTKTPGAFGWDDTASILPASMVPSYTGSSTYLLMTKYNNYAGIGTGNGKNKIAILDPNATEIDPVTGVKVMKEVLTILGPTPDPSHAGGVKEWCINSAAVDPATKSVLANSEDGKLYRWDLTTNTFSHQVTLTSGIGEAYTPTVVGADGTVYAINNATLFAVGNGISIHDVALNTGDSGTTTFNFTVSLTAADTHTITVDYATADGTATAGENDYVPASGTLTFNPGDTSKTISVTVNNADEAPENFFVYLSNPTNAGLARAQGTGTILGDPPAISIADVRLTDGSSGTTNASFKVTLASASTYPVTVQYATADGTATTADNDYKSKSGTLTFQPGVTTQWITVPVIGNTDVEVDENFLVSLSNPTNGILLRSQAVGTILNDDLNLSINDVSVIEVDPGATTANFTVTLSAAASFPVSVNYATGNGTASTGTDYAYTFGTLTFAPGTTTQTVPVPVLSDTADGGNETFYLRLSNSANAIISRAKGTATITDNVAQPSLSINNVSLGDGSSTTNFNFTVALSAPSGQTVTVQYATVDNTAIAGTDYTAASGTLTFAPGVTSQTVTVAVTGDSVSEADKTFYIDLSNPTNATLGISQGTGTIYNDDPYPLLSINNVTATDGSSGSKIFGFTVSLSAASSQPITVQYATADGTATAAEGDYQAKSGTLTFTSGQTQLTIAVTVNGNSEVEADESFTVNLSNATNARIITGQGVGTILDDDRNLSINDVSVTQPTTGLASVPFTVTLSAAAVFPVSVHFTTVGGSAHPGGDYVTTSGNLTFPAGQTSQTITVPILGEMTNQANETFTVVLSNSSNAIIARSKGTATVVNSAPLPVITINNVTLLENDGNTTTFTFTVSLSVASGQTVSVQFATADGTARTAENDYIAASGSLSFSPGQTSKTVSVMVNGDSSYESPENFFVNLTNPIHATLGNSQGTGTIINDDIG